MRPECRSYCCHFSHRSCLTSCFTFYSFFTTLVATRRCRCLLRSARVNVMPERLLSVISGILAGGSSLAGSSVLCFSVGVSTCDFAVVFSLAFVCRLWCFGASLFAVGGSPPPLTVVSLPLRLFPCGVLVQLLCWSLPLGIWFLHVTVRLPCPDAWVLWCFVSSLHLASWQQRHLALCGVWCYPLHHVLLLCSVLLR